MTLAKRAGQDKVGMRKDKISLVGSTDKLITRRAGYSKAGDKHAGRRSDKVDSLSLDAQPTDKETLFLAHTQQRRRWRDPFDTRRFPRSATTFGSGPTARGC